MDNTKIIFEDRHKDSLNIYKFPPFYSVLYHFFPFSSYSFSLSFRILYANRNVQIWKKVFLIFHIALLKLNNMHDIPIFLDENKREKKMYSDGIKLNVKFMTDEKCKKNNFFMLQLDFFFSLFHRVLMRSILLKNFLTLNLLWFNMGKYTRNFRTTCSNFMDIILKNKALIHNLLQKLK